MRDDINNIEEEAIKERKREYHRRYYESHKAEMQMFLKIQIFQVHQEL